MIRKFVTLDIISVIAVKTERLLYKNQIKDGSSNQSKLISSSSIALHFYKINITQAELSFICNLTVFEFGSVRFRSLLETVSRRVDFTYDDINIGLLILILG